MVVVVDGYKLSWIFCRSQRGAASQCLSIPQSDSPRSVNWTHSPSLRGASREQSQAGSARPTAMAPFEGFTVSSQQITLCNSVGMPVQNCPTCRRPPLPICLLRIPVVLRIRSTIGAQTDSHWPDGCKECLHMAGYACLVIRCALHMLALACTCYPAAAVEAG